MFSWEGGLMRTRLILMNKATGIYQTWLVVKNWAIVPIFMLTTTSPERYAPRLHSLFPWVLTKFYGCS